jgi:ABC-type phosphate transport system ATPase subunit
MPRPFNGQIHVRVPASVHEEVAKEAFDNGTSISGILAQALIVRRALRNIDPWKSIDEVQSANRGVSAAEVENSIAKALKAVRKARRGPDVRKARI